MRSNRGWLHGRVTAVCHIAISTAVSCVIARHVIRAVLRHGDAPVSECDEPPGDILDLDEGPDAARANPFGCGSYTTAETGSISRR